MIFHRTKDNMASIVTRNLTQSINNLNLTNIRRCLHHQLPSQLRKSKCKCRQHSKTNVRFLRTHTFTNTRVPVKLQVFGIGVGAGVTALLYLNKTALASESYDAGRSCGILLEHLCQIFCSSDAFHYTRHVIRTL